MCHSINLRRAQKSAVWPLTSLCTASVAAEARVREGEATPPERAASIENRDKHIAGEESAVAASVRKLIEDVREALKEALEDPDDPHVVLEQALVLLVNPATKPEIAALVKLLKEIDSETKKWVACTGRW